MSAQSTTLGMGRLLVLSIPYRLDGRVTTHPVDARGYAPMQCYLLKERDEALLLGTGLSTQQEEVLRQLEPALGQARLSLMPLGFDFTLVCNARPIADRFGLQTFYQRSFYEAPWTWLNLRPEFPIDESDGLRSAEVGVMQTSTPIFVGGDGERRLELVEPPLCLLPNHWLYDEATRTMFTVDLFAWVWRSDDRGPWVVSAAEDDPTTVETVEHSLFRNRYWWLPGAETSDIRRVLAEVFERYEIDNIAPEHGCVLQGSSVVSRHYQLLDDLLAEAPDRQPVGVDVGRWTFAGTS